MSKNVEIEIEDQRPDEKIILLRKMHPWVLAKPAIIAVILICLIVLMLYVFRFTPINIIICLVILAVLTSSILLTGFGYSNTLCIITSQRLIYVKQSNLFHRQVQEVELSSIYNLSYSMDGFWGTVFNFGNVRLNTQGDTADSITLENFENPSFIHEKLSRLHAEALKV